MFSFASDNWHSAGTALAIGQSHKYNEDSRSSRHNSHVMDDMIPFLNSALRDGNHLSDLIVTLPPFLILHLYPMLITSLPRPILHQIYEEVLGTGASIKVELGKYLAL